MEKNNGMIEILNPTIQDVSQDQKKMAPRLNTLNGTTIGLLSNSKHNANRLMEKTIAHLRKKYNIKEIITVNKNHPSEQITAKEIEVLKRSHAVITAIGD